MKDLFFFDGNCRIGDNLEKLPGTKELLAEMDRYGVDKALVRHNAIAPGGAAYTNESITALLKEDVEKRLVGVWSILPDTCGEQPEPDQFFKEMKENRIGAITLSPVQHRYIPRRNVIGKIMDAARERKVPVLLNAFAEKWYELYDFMEQFPDNICIYTEACGKWGYDRYIQPLLDSYSNFYFGTAGYWVQDGISDLVKKYGAERFIYGSNFPRYNHGNGMLQIKHAGLKDEEIRKIAGENLNSLLNGADL